MKKQQKTLLLLTVGAGLGYYYLIYLPEEEKKEQERIRLINEENQRKEEERQQADLDAAEREKQKEQEVLKKLENIKKKKLHWRRNREIKSWTDNWLLRKKESFEKTLNELGGEDNINIFDVSADYTIHFPPNLWNDLTEEQRTLATNKGHGKLELDEKTKGFRFNELVEKWYDKVVLDPIRGEQDPK